MRRRPLSNKRVREIAGGYSLIHDVESVPLAEEVLEARARKAKPARVTAEMVDAWMRKLYGLAKIRTVDFRRADRPNAPVGLIGVPSKYVAVIDAMHAAMTALRRGEPLPEFAAPEPKKGARL